MEEIFNTMKDIRPITNSQVTATEEITAVFRGYNFKCSNVKRIGES